MWENWNPEVLVSTEAIFLKKCADSQQISAFILIAFGAKNTES